jgi:hypothetical protein
MIVDADMDELPAEAAATPPPRAENRMDRRDSASAFQDPKLT